MCLKTNFYIFDIIKWENLEQDTDKTHYISVKKGTKIVYSFPNDYANIPYLLQSMNDRSHNVSNVTNIKKREKSFNYNIYHAHIHMYHLVLV